MKAVTVHPDSQSVELRELAPPHRQKETQVVIQMLEVGVCGTDREICAFEFGTPPSGERFFILGHESLGRVVDVGTRVANCRPGDLVAVTVRRPCLLPDCSTCREGQVDFCMTNGYAERGIQAAHGFMAETVVEDETYVVIVPPALRAIAVLIEPLSVVEKVLAQVWHIQERLPWVKRFDPGHPRGTGLSAVVLGAGPIGLLAAMMLSHAGFSTTVYSREGEHSPNAALAAAIGARYISSQTVEAEHLSQHTGRFDLIVEATGAARFAFTMLKQLGPNGIYAFTGLPSRKGPIELDADFIMRNIVLKNQAIFGSVNAGRKAYEDAVDDLAIFQNRWPEALPSMITARFPLERYRDLLIEGRPGIKNVLSFEESSQSLA